MRVEIRDEFWSAKRELNQRVALPYQWEQYKNCGTLQNFISIDEKNPSGRSGYFYNDSDLHKWADAASRVLASTEDKILEERVDEYIELMERVQDNNGYLFTWNQLYSPKRRWKSLSVEHELYCIGHFIEAGVSHFLATKGREGERRLLNLAIKSADLVVREFHRINFKDCPGHQEIEVALLRLYQVTKESRYLQTAEQFLLKRGGSKWFGLYLLRDVTLHIVSNFKSRRFRQEKKSNELGFEFGENIQPKEPAFLMLRAFLSFLNGSYLQQHLSLLKQREPKGHAVRWAYMMLGSAHLVRERFFLERLEKKRGEKTEELLSLLKESWNHLVEKKTYVTGGIGSLPVIEGFGRDYELNNEFSYSETCAAIGSILFTQTLLTLSPEAKYGDLIERQLYNAVGVGISLDGKHYFYRNPLESKGELERFPWFKTACCPSNISRLWGDIHQFIYHRDEQFIYINQYIGSTAYFEDEGIQVEMESNFPWDGKVRITLSHRESLSLKLRVPGWADSWEVRVDDEVYSQKISSEKGGRYPLYTDLMMSSQYIQIDLKKSLSQTSLIDEKKTIEIDFPMEILLNRSHPKVKSNRGKVALSRGPLIYCVESKEEIQAKLNLGSNAASLDFKLERELFGIPCGRINQSGLEFIPYYLWGNRGKSWMKVWIDSEE